LAFRGDRTLVVLGGELGQLCILLGQRLLRFLQRLYLLRELGHRVLNLLLKLSLLRLARKQLRGFFSELQLESANGVGLLANVAELTRALRLELLDAHFQAPRRHGKLGAQLVLLGLDLGERNGRERLDPSRGQPHRPSMDERNKTKNEQSRDQKSDPRKH